MISSAFPCRHPGTVWPAGWQAMTHYIGVVASLAIRRSPASTQPANLHPPLLMRQTLPAMDRSDGRAHRILRRGCGQAAISNSGDVGTLLVQGRQPAVPDDERQQ